ncbi:PilZ domain-containing protein [Sphingomonas arvum]|uniref:PilZ domain-containing protein n=1 Tax=Sphingomonas arvum TaxID=2992113 RepID=UPI0038B28795
MFGEAPASRELTIKLRGGHTYSGRVAWQKGHETGIQFYSPLSQSELEAVLCAPVNGARAPRLSTSTKVLVRSGASVSAGTMVNVSPRGAGLTLADPEFLQPSIKLGIPGLGTLGAQIRWQKGNQAGVSFNEVVLLKDLARCIQASAIG